MTSAHPRTVAGTSIKTWLLAIILIGMLGVLIMYRRGTHGGTASVPSAFDKSVTVDAAMQASGSDGKPVMMMFTADWCGPCQMLKKTALNDPRVIEALKNKTHPVYVDATNSTPKEVTTYKIEGYPTLLMVKNGKEVGRIVGARGADDVLKWINSNS